MILITGANGLIGSFLVKDLAEKGYNILALVRTKETIKEIAGVEWVIGDINDSSTLKEHIERCSIVIHTAAMISFKRKDRESMYQTNVYGTRNIVDLATENKIDKFLHFSSVGALGGIKSTHIDESSEFIKEEPRSYYGYTKYMSELEVWKAHEEGLDTVILNPSVVLGPGDWEKSSTTLFKYIWDQNQYYSGGSINFVDIRDIATAVENIIEGRNKDAKYILNGGKTDYKSFFDLIAQRFNKRPPKKKASSFQIQLLVAFSYIMENVFGKEPMITKETSRMANSDVSYNNSKFLNDLILECKNLDNSVSWVCRELSKKYNLKTV